MRALPFTRRTRIGLALFAFAMLIAFFPLRLAIGWADEGLAARQVAGPVWWGRIDGLTVGPVWLGDVDASVSPVQLLVGRVRLDIWRRTGQPDDLAGAWTAGFNQRGLDDVTGMVPLAGAFAPLPLTTLELDDVTIHFAGDTCSKAEGHVRARLSGTYAGLALAQGLSGDATCDGQAVLLPLVSQTGMERLSLRFWRDGRYTAQIAVKAEGNGNAEIG
ncbi:MAG: type II secretion system protein N, partial [Sphingobium sp.]